MTTLAFDAAIGAAEKIVKHAQAAGRACTPSERSEVEQLLVKAQDAKDWAKIGEQIEAMRSGGAGDTRSSAGFGSAILAAAFDVKSNPAVDIQPTFLLKASTFPAAGDIARTSPALIERGRDSRWLHPHLPREAIGDSLSVQDFRQTSRTVTGDPERAPASGTVKASLDVAIEHVNEAVQQAAVIIPAVPLELFESMAGLRQFLDSEGVFQVEKAVDSHVFAKIVAAGPDFGNTGTGFVARVRNAIGAMRANGATPDLLVVNPSDAAELDLEQDAGGYVFPTRTAGVGSPLWGLRVIERTSAAGTEPPYLVDTNMLGKLYIGTLRLDVDPYAGTGGANFSRNLVDLRV